MMIILNQSSYFHFTWHNLLLFYGFGYTFDQPLVLFALFYSHMILINIGNLTDYHLHHWIVFHWSRMPKARDWVYVAHLIRRHSSPMNRLECWRRFYVLSQGMLLQRLRLSLPMSRWTWDHFRRRMLLLPHTSHRVAIRDHFCFQSKRWPYLDWSDYVHQSTMNLDDCMWNVSYFFIY